LTAATRGWNITERGPVGVAGLGSGCIFSVSGLVVSVFAGDNRFKSVRVGGGTRRIGDDTPSEMISILIGRRPSTIFPSYFA